MVNMIDGKPWFPFWERQDDAVISQANPVSTTEYEVLSTANARIYGIQVETTGGTVQNLDVHVYLDGVEVIHNQDPPVGGTSYYAQRILLNAENAQTFDVSSEVVTRKAYLHESKSVRVTAAVTWTVQPSPLECRVKYAVMR